MPPVEAPHGRTVVVVIGVGQIRIMPGIKRISKVRRGIALLLHISVRISGKTPGASEIIFHSRSADRRECTVPVDVEFHFAFAPPVPLQGRQGDVGSHIPAAALHPVQNHIVRSLFRDRLAPP